MYNVRESIEQNFKIYELIDTDTNSWVKVAPERGGIIISYGVQGEELLYLNEETFFNKYKNVRGGIPVLFPISGQLANGTYEWEGKSYTMPNHGFARNASWEVMGQEVDNRASLSIKLTSTVQTKLSYPFDFSINFTYVLESGKLTIKQEYNNLCESPMPIYPGFHPYFKTSKKKLAYETDATELYDYNDNQVKQFTGTIDLTNLKESVVFLDSNDPSISFGDPAAKKRIKLSYGKQFKYIVIWTESGNEFVCVEPWMAKTDEMNRKEELVMIDGNQSLVTEFSIEVNE